jgi:hypothetical protein
LQNFLAFVEKWKLEEVLQNYIEKRKQWFFDDNEYLHNKIKDRLCIRMTNWFFLEEYLSLYEELIKYKIDNLSEREKKLWLDNRFNKRLERKKSDH